MENEWENFTMKLGEESSASDALDVKADQDSMCTLSKITQNRTVLVNYTVYTTSYVAWLSRLQVEMMVLSKVEEEEEGRFSLRTRT